MPERRPTVRLGEVVSLQTGFPFKSDLYSDDPADPRLLRGDNVAQGRLRWDGGKRYPSGLAAQLQEFGLARGDVILAMDRPWIEAGLKYAVVTDDDLPSLLVQRVARLRGTDRVDTGYLRYVVASRAFTDYILGVQTGTAVPHISGEQIRGFSFSLPPLPEQRAIAAVLGSLDDKIDLNRRMNATLEATARAIFKAWFVDFEALPAEAGRREPVSMVAERAAVYRSSSAAGSLPPGWREGSLGDVATNPRRGVGADEIAPLTAYIGLEHMPRRSIALSDWGTSDGLESNKFAFRAGEILFGKLRPYFHKVGVAPVEGVCSTDILVVSPLQPEWEGFVLGHISSDEFVAYTDASSAGTKMPRTNWGDMARYPLALPPPEAARRYTEVVRPMIKRIISNIHEARTLAALRDTLLPKLLSGEVRVKGVA